MFYSTILLAATALTGLVSAQNYSTSGPLMVDPNSIDYNTRLAWCQAQRNSCPEICGGQAFPNSCDPNALTYNCTCTNGQMPNVTSFTQTMPFFVCQQWKANCVAAHPNDLDGQSGCQSVTCGSLNASDSQSSSSSSASSTMMSTSSAAASSTGGAAGGAASASSTPTGSSSASAASASSTKSSGAMAVGVAQQYGSGILVAGLLAAFGLAM